MVNKDIDVSTVDELIPSQKLLLPQYDEKSNAPAEEGLIHITGDGSDSAGTYGYDGSSWIGPFGSDSGSSTDTRTNISADGSQVVSDVSDINFTGASTITTDDGDGSVTVDSTHDHTDETLAPNRVRTIKWVDSGPDIQPAIDEVSNSGGGDVVVTGGNVFVSEQVTVKSGVRLTCTPETVIFHDFGPSTVAAIHFLSGSECGFVKVDGQSESAGVKLNEDGIEGQVHAERVEAVSCGTQDNCHAVEITGYYTVCNHINTLGGSNGIYATGSDIFINSAIPVHAVTGANFAGAQTVQVSNLDIDSPREGGLQMDSCYDVDIRGSIWFNASVYSSSSRWRAMNIGTYSSGSPNKSCRLDIGLHETGGQVGYLGYNNNCHFTFNVTNNSRNGVTTPGWDSGLEFSGNQSEVLMDGTYGSAVPATTGTVASSVTDNIVYF